MSLEVLKAYSKEQQNQAENIPFPGKPKMKPQNVVLTAHMELEQKRLELYRHVQENIRKSSQLRSKINKDIQAGANHYSVLLDAIQCISLMTGDTVFYEQNIKVLEERKP